MDLNWEKNRRGLSVFHAGGDSILICLVLSCIVVVHTLYSRLVCVSTHGLTSYVFISVNQINCYTGLIHGHNEKSSLLKFDGHHHEAVAKAIKIIKVRQRSKLQGQRKFKETYDNTT